MLYLSTDEIDRLIKEDVPYFDLTSWSLGLGEQRGKITYYTREDAVGCGTEEVRQIFERLHIEAQLCVASGTRVKAGAELIAGTGRAQDLHMAWKVGQNILDHCSGIATKTRKMIDAAKAINPRMAVLSTRKIFPGTKALAIKAIMAGGAMPHRLGISETILIFKQHMNFVGGLDGLIKKLPEMKAECCEKKIIVEVESFDQAARLCRAGADGIQFDKMTIGDLAEAAACLKERFPAVVILAAGGIHPMNVAEYAKLPIDAVVTTSLYSAKPIDIGVKIDHG